MSQPAAEWHKVRAESRINFALQEELKTRPSKTDSCLFSSNLKNSVPHNQNRFDVQRQPIQSCPEAQNGPPDQGNIPLNDAVTEVGPPPDLLRTMGDGEVLSLDAETGRATMAFTVKPEFCHSGYICQGGYVCGWIDSAMAHAVMGQTDGTLSPATLEIKVTYLKAAIKGTRVKAIGWIEKRGKHIAFLEGEVLNEKDEVIAKATSTVQLMPFKRGDA